jgi:hypothetical protein
VSADPVERLREELHGFMAEMRGHFQAIEQRFEAVDRRFEAIDRRFGDLETNLRRHIDEVSAADRRWFGVLAEGLQTKIELVIEGVKMVDEKLDRHRVETGEELGKVDRRLMHISARIHPRRRR